MPPAVDVAARMTTPPDMPRGGSSVRGRVGVRVGLRIRFSGVRLETHSRGLGLGLGGWGG